MCLAIPGKIVDTFESGSMRMGRIDYGGIEKEACLSYVPDAKIGDYVIVHAGFALNVLAPDEAEETLRVFRELGEISSPSSPPNPRSQHLSPGLPSLLQSSAPPRLCGRGRGTGARRKPALAPALAKRGQRGPGRGSRSGEKAGKGK